ncbi:hypothetical protein [Metallibacterium sp.]|jgi:hypothetical protein|uniref:hypothetical protein n=1 Tax=Metallibacterium sp. TaxID=2940281 RepID=UPI002613D496|nr:hypothetical protein [Metallibacterium sp.]
MLGEPLLNLGGDLSMGSGFSVERRQSLAAGAMNNAAQMLTGAVALALMALLAGERMHGLPDRHVLRPSAIWRYSARYSDSAPTRDCCATYSRLWPPAMPTSTHRWRCYWVHCGRRTRRRIGVDRRGMAIILGSVTLTSIDRKTPQR